MKRLAKRLAFAPSSVLHSHRHPSPPRLRRDRSGGQLGGPRPAPPTFEGIELANERGGLRLDFFRLEALGFEKLDRFVGPGLQRHLGGGALRRLGLNRGGPLDQVGDDPFPRRAGDADVDFGMKSELATRSKTATEETVRDCGKGMAGHGGCKPPPRGRRSRAEVLATFAFLLGMADAIRRHCQRQPNGRNFKPRQSGQTVT